MHDRADRKKVLFLITKSNFGGAQRYVYDLATGLPTDQYEVVVAFGGSGTLAERLSAAGIRTITVDSFQRDISLSKEFRAIAELWRLFRTEQPDIVHCNSSKAVALGVPIGRLAGVPRIVSTIHGWPYLEDRGWLWKRLAWLGSWIPSMLSHAVILVSEHDQTKRPPFLGRKTSVIHTAIKDTPIMQRDDARDALFPAAVQDAHRTDVWLATTAELTSNKNIETAIDAVCECNRSSRQQIFYAVIGDGELRHDLATYIRERGATSFVTLLGHVPNARAYLHAFDLFLLPSRKEGLPYALLEAGAAGLPVIASRVGGIPEVVTDGESGLLIDPYDPDTIVRAIKTLTAEPVLREQFRERLQARITNEFSLDHMIAATCSVYRSLTPRR